MNTDRTQRARTQADRWTPHVAENINSDEGLTLFAESRAARSFAAKGAYAVLYRDGSATVGFAGGAVAVNPLFSSEAELVRDQRDTDHQPWLSDLFTVLEAGELEYRGEARTAWRGYVDELQTLASEIGAAIGLMDPPPPPSAKGNGETADLDEDDEDDAQQSADTGVGADQSGSSRDLTLTGAAGLEETPRDTQRPPVAPETNASKSSKSSKGKSK